MRKYEDLTTEKLLKEYEKYVIINSNYGSEPEGLCGKLSLYDPAHPMNKYSDLREEVFLRLKTIEEFGKTTNKIKKQFP